MDRLALELQPVERLEQIQLAPLFGQRELVVVDVGDQRLGIEVLADQRRVGLFLHLVGDERALVDGRQKRAVPQRRPDRRRHVGTEDDEARQVLVVGAETVREPRADRRPARLRVARFIISSDGSWFGMSVYIERMTQMSSTHSPTCGNSSLTSMPLWPYFLNVNGERISSPVLPLGRDRPAGQRLAVILVEHRLGIEGVDLRRAAVHEQEDDALGARGVIQLALVDAAVLRERPGRPDDRLADQAGERQHAEPVAHPAQASRRVSGCRDLCGAMSIHEQEFARAEQDSSRTVPRRVAGKPFLPSSFFAAPGMTPAIMPSPTLSRLVALVVRRGLLAPTARVRADLRIRAVLCALCILRVLCVPGVLRSS